MNKLFILPLFIVVTFKSVAQVTSLSETFNTYCAVLGETYPPNWSAYDNAPDPAITWTCGPDQGRGATSTSTSPGILCTNQDGANTYLDTAWLFTPQLNLSFYTGSIYLQFDSKYVIADGRFSVLVSNNYEDGWSPDTILDTHTWYDASSSVTPILGNVGTSDWVTYVVNLTAFKAAPMYVAFRYTANAGGQTEWIIDNVYTTQTPPNSSVPVVNKQSLFLNIIGTTTPNEIPLSYNVSYAATYQLAIYDMMGRSIYKESIDALPGETAHTISGLNLAEGMYLVKMENGSVYNTAKVMIR